MSRFESSATPEFSFGFAYYKRRASFLLLVMHAIWYPEENLRALKSLNFEPSFFEDLTTPEVPNDTKQKIIYDEFEPLATFLHKNSVEVSRNLASFCNSFAYTAVLGVLHDDLGRSMSAASLLPPTLVLEDMDKSWGQGFRPSLRLGYFLSNQSTCQLDL